MRYIQDLRENDIIKNEIYLCKSKQTLTGKSGKSYVSLILQDKTGTIDGKIWDFNNEIEQYEAMDFVHIDARVTSFQDNLQLNISKIYKGREGEYYPEDYFPVTSKNIDAMYKEIKAYVAAIKEPNLKELAEAFFIEDADFIKKFKNHSAAKSVHHGFVGGLLEHTLSVVKLCEYYTTSYPILNKDLLITAALFHDIGKMEELSAFPENDYTNDGQLLGHIFIGANIVSNYIKKKNKFPAKLSNELLHCILAHHGELEFGSPKKPATAEALALHFADNTDAKMQTITELLGSGDQKTEWMGYQRLFESNIMRSTKGIE
ncbi:HD domain-containing protein [Lachnospiraceae bacterium MD1]|jgi:3'-5' exoribonuclease|uniref:HD domain-containing protein n=1 Tax=Variimorphobacter saccharofermentans TaxID=2755051 RepID=A0A839K558_9FIRM|nr:HD domain-containing protein [Variimorphobacter saccharofermentans]MBB2184498.1 HD domain-containing protein [Variimorphobacter saccharofermentans]